MTSHTVKSFDADLAGLIDLTSEIGRTASAQVRGAIDALRAIDPNRAAEVIRSDDALDALHRLLEERVIAVIARRQPVAIDLRITLSALKIAGNLERIGDLAKNIAKRTGVLTVPVPGIDGLIDLGEAALALVNRSMQAFERQSDQIAAEVWLGDAKLDSMHNRLFRELLTYMIEDPRRIGVCTHCLFCAKNFERIGDHATNIAEHVHYIQTGRQSPLERPKEALEAVPAARGGETA